MSRRVLTVCLTGLTVSGILARRSVAETPQSGLKDWYDRLHAVKDLNQTKKEFQQLEDRNKGKPINEWSYQDKQRYAQLYTTGQEQLGGVIGDVPFVNVPAGVMAKGLKKIEDAVIQPGFQNSTHRFREQYEPLLDQMNKEDAGGQTPPVPRDNSVSPSPNAAIPPGSPSGNSAQPSPNSVTKDLSSAGPDDDPDIFQRVSELYDSKREDLVAEAVGGGSADSSGKTSSGSPPRTGLNPCGHFWVVDPDCEVERLPDNLYGPNGEAPGTFDPNKVRVLDPDTGKMTPVEDLKKNLNSPLDDVLPTNLSGGPAITSPPESRAIAPSPADILSSQADQVTAAQIEAQKTALAAQTSELLEEFANSTDSRLRDLANRMNDLIGQNSDAAAVALRDLASRNADVLSQAQQARMKMLAGAMQNLTKAVEQTAKDLARRNGQGGAQGGGVGGTGSGDCCAQLKQARASLQRDRQHAQLGPSSPQAQAVQVLEQCCKQ